VCETQQFVANSGHAGEEARTVAFGCQAPLESLGVLFPAACGDVKNIFLVDTPSACGGVVHCAGLVRPCHQLRRAIERQSNEIVSPEAPPSCEQKLDPTEIAGLWELPWNWLKNRFLVRLTY
jgi:hypothetical protein